MDEMMEVLTLVQTEKLRKEVFIVLYGGDFWNSIINFGELAKTGVISPADLKLFKTCNTPKEAFNYLKRKLTDRYLNE